MEDRRLDHYAPIGLGRCHVSNGELDQGADKTGSNEGQRRQQWQPFGNGLPKQVVCCLKGCADAVVLTLVQRCPSLSRPGRQMSRLSHQQSDHSSESSSPRWGGLLPLLPPARPIDPCHRVPCIHDRLSPVPLHHCAYQSLLHALTPIHRSVALHHTYHTPSERHANEEYAFSVPLDGV